MDSLPSSDNDFHLSTMRLLTFLRPTYKLRLPAWISAAYFLLGGLFVGDSFSCAHLS